MTEVIATTGSGRIRGFDADGIKTFKGIPYAAPPTGERRFRPPQPVEPWTGVREALEYGPSSPQPTQRPPGWAHEARESEDCLYLNVWTPGVGDGGRRPVMVWIHGGGYAIGSGSWPLYDATALARRGDAVVVTLNHRLGALGYLHLGEIAGEDFAASGNNGMLDLVAALEWVRDNIAELGGDPGNVTIFGESGGGSKVSMLLTMPSARGLFHRAAIQSGPGLRATPVEAATRSARSLLESLGVSESRIGELWALPAERFVGAGRRRPEQGASNARAASGERGSDAMRFSPVLDGTVLPAHPGDALADGSAADVPVIVGCNRDEFGGAPEDLDEAGLRERLARFGEDNVQEIMNVYKDLFPDAPPWQILTFVNTDSGMRAGSIRLAEQKLKGSATPVYMYFFTYELGGRAGHGYEIAFVFDNVGRDAATRPSPARQQLADTMSEAWLAFARSGDPNHARMSPWPAYTLPDRPTMIFGRGDSAVVNDPSGPARELWQRIPAGGRRGA